MTPINAVYATIKVAIEAILSAKPQSWKKTAKLTHPKIQIGKNIVSKETIGIR